LERQALRGSIRAIGLLLDRPWDEPATRWTLTETIDSRS
jgi:hypothetical protein